MSELILKSTGRRLTVTPDEFAESPRTWALGTRFYGLACRRSFGADEYMSDAELRTKAREARRAGLNVFPVYAHIHSGVVLSLSAFADRWDSGCCGLMIVNVKDEKAAEDMAAADIEALNRWLAGCVYCVAIEHPAGYGGEVDESIGSVYADDEADAALQALEYFDLTDAEAKEIRERVTEL